MSLKDDFKRWGKDNKKWSDSTAEQYGTVFDYVDEFRSDTGQPWTHIEYVAKETDDEWSEASELKYLIAKTENRARVLQTALNGFGQWGSIAFGSMGVLWLLLRFFAGRI